MKAFSLKLLSVARHSPVIIIAVFAAAFLSVFFVPHIAAAQTPIVVGTAPTLGDIMCNVFDNVSPYSDLLSAIAYIAGGILIGAGLLSLKDHSDNPGNNPLH